MDWPGWAGNQHLDQVGRNTGASSGTVITALANNAKSSYVQLAASSPLDADWISVFISTQENIAADFLVDLAIGGAGSEKVILANLGLSTTAGVGGNVAVFSVPLSIPAGSRIAARAQNSAGTNRDITVLAMLASGLWLTSSPSQLVSTYGANTGTSGGVSIDPGGSANTKGSWVQISASVDLDIAWLCLAVMNQVNGVRTNATWLVDIGIGGAGSEKVMVPDILLSVHSAGDLVNPCVVMVPVSIPTGSRLVARAQSSITDATDRLFDLIAYGAGN